MPQSDLDRAIELNDLAEVERLVKNGANLEAMGDYDGTPLANAAALGRLEIVKFLLGAGADPTLGGCRPVMGNAAGLGYFEICRVLIDAGADPNEQDEDGGTAASIAVYCAQLNVLRLLVDRGAKLEPLDDYVDYAASLNKNGSHDSILEYLGSLRT